jgi:hypothetical protein
MKHATIFSLVLMMSLALAACGGGGGGGGGGGQAAAPAVGGSGGGGGGAATQGDGSDGGASQQSPDGGQAGEGSDGAAGSDPGTGQDGSAPTPTAHEYLVALIGGEVDEALAAAFARAAHHAAEIPAEAVLWMLEPEIGAEIADQIRSAVPGELLTQPLGEAALAYLEALIDGSRRAARARASEAALNEEIQNSSLATDVALGDGTAALADQIAALEAAVDDGLEASLAEVMAGEQEAPALPDAVPVDDNANINGMAALDAAVLSQNVLTRARLGEAAAMDLVVTLYDAYDAMISANPGALANSTAIQAGLQTIRDEIRGLRAALAGLDLRVASETVPVYGQPHEMVVRAANVGDQAQVEWAVDSTPGLEVNAQADGLVIIDPENRQARSIQVVGRSGEYEETLEIRVIPLGGPVGDPEDPQDEPAIAGSVLDRDGNPIAGVTYELRENAEFGPVARDMNGQEVRGSVDPEGEFQLTQIHPAAYVLVIQAPDHPMRFIPVDTTGAPVDLGPITLE